MPEPSWPGISLPTARPHRWLAWLATASVDPGAPTSSGSREASSRVRQAPKPRFLNSSYRSHMLERSP